MKTFSIVLLLFLIFLTLTQSSVASEKSRTVLLKKNQPYYRSSDGLHLKKNENIFINIDPRPIRENWYSIQGGKENYLVPSSSIEFIDDLTDISHQPDRFTDYDAKKKYHYFDETVPFSLFSHSNLHFGYAYTPVIKKLTRSTTSNAQSLRFEEIVFIKGIIPFEFGLNFNLEAGRALNFTNYQWESVSLGVIARYPLWDWLESTIFLHGGARQSLLTHLKDFSDNKEYLINSTSIDIGLHTPFSYDERNFIAGLNCQRNWLMVTDFSGGAFKNDEKSRGYVFTVSLFLGYVIPITNW